jgi:hypothetical protein
VLRLCPLAACRGHGSTRSAAVAFSPADTAPTAARAKLLMMVQSLIALVILVVVVGRAVNCSNEPEARRTASCRPT